LIHIVARAMAAVRAVLMVHDAAHAADAVMSDVNVKIATEQGRLKMKVKQKLFIHIGGHKELSVDVIDKTKYDWCDDVCVGSVDVEFEFEMPSDIEIRDSKIATIKAAITKTQADAQVKVEGLLDEIQKLMAIGVDA